MFLLFFSGPKLVWKKSRWNLRKAIEGTQRFYNFVCKASYKRLEITDIRCNVGGFPLILRVHVLYSLISSPHRLIYFHIMRDNLVVLAFPSFVAHTLLTLSFFHPHQCTHTYTKYHTYRITAHSLTHSHTHINEHSY